MPIPDHPHYFGREPHKLRAMIGRIESELAKIADRLRHAPDQQDRIFLKAEQAHFCKFLSQLDRGKRRRKPPEAGMPVPAVPPKGPLPMQGGAEAPLDFGD